jgi:hypothetical protein
MPGCYLDEYTTPSFQTPSNSSVILVSDAILATFCEELIAWFSWYFTDRIENDEYNSSSLVACVFVAEVTFYRAVA